MRNPFRMASAALRAAGLAVVLFGATLAQGAATVKPEAAAASSSASAPKSSVVIAEATAPSGGINLTEVGDPQVMIALTLSEKQGQPATVTLESSPFTSASGETVAAQFIEGDSPVTSIRLKANESKRIWVKALLLNAGTYQLVLRPLLSGDKAVVALDPMPISVVRVKAVPPVEFVATPALEMQTDWSAAAASAPRRIKAYASGGAFSLPQPHLARATRKPAADSAEGIATTLDLNTTATTPILLKPGEAAPIDVTLTDIPGPGRYDAALRFALPGYKAIDTELVVYVREPWTKAFFFLFLGVLVSFVLHAWSATVRPGLVVKQRVEALLGQLDEAKTQAAADADALALVEGVRAALQRLWDQAQRSRVVLGAGVDVYETIVPALAPWIGLHRQLKDLRPASVRKTHLAALDNSKTEFLAAAPDAAKVQAAVKTIEAMPQQIRQDIGNELTKKIAALDKELAASESPGLIRVRGSLALIEPHLEGGRIEVAVGAYDAALLLYLNEMAQELRKLVSPPAKQPAGFKDDEWLRLTTDTLKALDLIADSADPDAKLAQLRQASTVYLQSFGAALKGASEDQGDAVKKEVAAAIEGMDTAIGEKNSLVAAWIKLGEAQKAYGKAIDLGGKSMGMDVLASAAAAPSAAFDAVAAFFLPASWQSLDRARAAGTTRRALGWGDGAMSLSVLVVAGFIGLQALWVPNLTWGGWAAYLAAFLWGFAADQFTHAGVAALRK